MASANEISVRGLRRVFASENPSRSTVACAGVSCASVASGERARSFVESLSMRLLHPYFFLIPLPEALHACFDRDMWIIAKQAACLADIGVGHQRLVLWQR